MAYYGGIYRSYFDSISLNDIHHYKLEIYKKDFYGDITDIQLGANPVVQEWIDDEPFKQIKTSTLKVNIINDGTISLENFYSNFDNEFQVILYRIDFADEVIFKGFVSFDDCAEILVQYAHEIQIVASDGLAYLKKIPFDQASINLGSLYEDEINVNLIGNIIKINGYIYPYLNIKVGSSVMVDSGDTLLDGTYTVLEVGTALANPDAVPPSTNPYTYLTVNKDFGIVNDLTINLTYTIPYNINKYLKLSEIFKLCLKSIPYELEEFRVVSRLALPNESSFLGLTYMHFSSFMNGTEYMDCYSIIEEICNSFSATLFQYRGFWYFVRWGEYTLFNDYETGLRFSTWYDSNFEPITQTYIESNFYIDLDNAETGVIKSLLRPYSYVKETINYEEPENRLYNADFGITPVIVAQYGYTSDMFFIYESEGFSSYVPNITWYAETLGNIVVNKNVYTGEEKDRYLSIPYPIYTSGYHSVKSNEISIKEGDVVEYTFDIKTVLDQYEDSGYKVVFDIVLTDGTNTYYGIGNEQAKFGSYPVTYLRAGQWYQTNEDLENRGYQYRGNSDVNAKDWQNINIKLDPAPINGNLIICFTSIANGVDGNNETRIKNIDLKINSILGGSRYVKGFYSKAKSGLKSDLYLEKDIVFGYSANSTLKNNFFIDGDSLLTVSKAINWRYINNGYKIYNETVSSFDTGSGRFFLNVFGQNYSGNPPIDIYFYPAGTEFEISNSDSGLIDGLYTILSISQTMTNAGIEYFVIYLDGTEIPVDYFGDATLTFNNPQKFLLTELDVREQLLLRYNQSIKLDLNIVNIDFELGPLTIIQYANTDYPEGAINYIFGSLSVNYRENNAQATLYGFIDERNNYSQYNNNLFVENNFIKTNN
jgi:hypothetical protein